MSHTGSSIAAWPQSRASSLGSKHGKEAKQYHLKSRSNLVHAGKFVNGFVPGVFLRTLWLYKKWKSELQKPVIGTLIHSCSFKKQLPVLGQYSIGTVGQYSIGADTEAYKSMRSNG